MKRLLCLICVVFCIYNSYSQSLDGVSLNINRSKLISILPQNCDKNVINTNNELGYMSLDDKIYYKFTFENGLLVKIYKREKVYETRNPGNRMDYEVEKVMSQFLDSWGEPNRTGKYSLYWNFPNAKASWGYHIDTEQKEVYRHPSEEHFDAYGNLLPNPYWANYYQLYSEAILQYIEDPRY